MSNWPVFVVILAVLFAAAAFIHAAMTKDDVRSALGWSAIALLSPFVGAFIYAVFGINRVSRSSFRNRRARSRSAMPVDRGEASPDWLSEAVGANLAPLITLGDRVTTLPITAANSVTLLDGGDETYGAMIEAISNARRSVYLETYIFDDDPLGQQIAEALAAAAKRDVDVRVLIDAVGARYSRPPITRRLGKAGVRHAKFLGRLLPLRLPYANLRSHRKIMIIDGEIGFAGGMNIRDEFARSIVGDDYAVDTHFRLGGPIVSQLGRVFASDWHFSTGEELHGQIDMSHPASSDPLFCRAIDSGPDDDGLERTMGVILGALAIAKERVLICSPYFLPDVRLVAALAVAARRGVRVDIVIPERSNLRLVGWAITAQLDQVMRPGCHVWRSTGAFDHSKLMVVDQDWVLIGSSNFDSRSLRLNFEIDIEVFDAGFASSVASHIERRIKTARKVTLEALLAMPFWVRVRNRIVWMASPYL